MQYKWKNHFYEMKADVGMSHHEKEREQEDAYTKRESHNPIPTSLKMLRMYYSVKKRAQMHDFQIPT